MSERLVISSYEVSRSIQEGSGYLRLFVVSAIIKVCERDFGLGGGGPSCWFGYYLATSFLVIIHNQDEFSLAFSD